ncbi:MAG: ribbon-helix-helix protein, CopG family [DPANN group archaeon]|nr:ribbon-helix-helix protein, CopG family [DPANN group archaeon]
MVTEMITVKLEKKFLGEVDNIVKKHGYQNRTEFIRNALREKVDEAKLREAMMSIAHLKGAAKKKTTEEEYERIREQVFDEFDKKLR